MEFLDTCFVLMPFGNWYDRYYSEIYASAIIDAGFEPVRADGLFSTGSVMEQILEQIHKAKVLRADLTGKNPNVFYELGLSHARRKPVVFVSGDLEDVPFDLRHLRVVIYEVREPKWDEKLRKHITAYLKNAKTDPAKSIPQPFRSTGSDEEVDMEEAGVVTPVIPLTPKATVGKAVWFLRLGAQVSPSFRRGNQCGFAFIRHEFTPLQLRRAA